MGEEEMGKSLEVRDHIMPLRKALRINTRKRGIR